MSFLLNNLITFYCLLLIARWVVENFLTDYEATGWFLKIKDFTNPVVNLVDKLIPSFNGISFTYIIAIVGVKLAGNMVVHLFFGR